MRSAAQSGGAEPIAPPQTGGAGGDPAPPPLPGGGELALFALLGLAFGVILIRSEVVSWFRIQEMFRFQGFHMFGVFATAIPTAVLSLHLIRRFDVRARGGEPVRVPSKVLGRGYRYVFGGLAFGVGWALTGACPGPLLALVGSGVGVILFVLGCAVLGTWTYGHARERLPHY